MESGQEKEAVMKPTLRQITAAYFSPAGSTKKAAESIAEKGEREKKLRLLNKLDNSRKKIDRKSVV